MIELVFVVVVIGILAAVIIPSTRTNPVAEASIKLISNIRYAQHLAMVDDKFDATNNTWYVNRWKIVFDVTGKKFSIKHNNTEFAKDPQNPAKNIEDIELKGVTVGLTGTGCNAATTISFDHLGRPLIGTLTSTHGQLLTTDCNITVTDGSNPITLTMRSETGYVSGI